MSHIQIIKKITTFFFLLLATVWMSSCGCASKKKGEQDHLLVEEKKLRKKLKASFKPDVWEQWEKTIKNHRENINEINKQINSTKDLQEKLKNVNVLDPTNIVADFKDQPIPMNMVGMEPVMRFVLSLEGVPVPPSIDLSNLSSMNATELQKNQQDLLPLLSILNNKSWISKVNLVLQNLLALWRNLKKQAILKSKSVNAADNATDSSASSSDE